MRRRFQSANHHGLAPTIGLFAGAPALAALTRRRASSASSPLIAEGDPRQVILMTSPRPGLEEVRERSHQPVLGNVSGSG